MGRPSRHGSDRRNSRSLRRRRLPAFPPAGDHARPAKHEESLPHAWSRYGFVDAFNPLTNWYDTDVIGIDTGITMLMAENARSGFVWETFMKNPEAQRGMVRAGFQEEG